MSYDSAKCPYCKTPIDQDTNDPGFVWVSQISTFVSDELGHARVWPMGIMARQRNPPKPNLFVTTTHECASCSKIWDEPNPTLPDFVRADLREALICLRMDAHVAANLMFRRILEAAAIANGAKGRTLRAKIDHLADAGVLKGALPLWTEIMKYWGDLAAHPDKQPQPGHDMEWLRRFEAKDLILFIYAVIQSLYICAPVEEFDPKGVWRSRWT